MKHVKTISMAAGVQDPIGHSGVLLQLVFGFILDLVQQKGKGEEIQ